jgi:hypothetical protein
MIFAVSPSPVGAAVSVFLLVTTLWFAHVRFRKVNP